MNVEKIKKMTQALARTREFLDAIKFEHTIFALPFALIASLLARRGHLPSGLELMWIVLAMVGARTWAMGVNRFADARIDALNPRTATRAVPAGKISTASMVTFSALGAILFICSAAALSRTAFICSFFVLAILASYSFTKRFTFLCHFWLGLCLGLAPLGAWVALRNEIPPQLLLLSAGIMMWVAGFDIIYALQDETFDKNNNLYSIPARFGTWRALWIARISHCLACIAFLNFGLEYNLGVIYLAGLGIATALMVYEHHLVRAGNLQKINMAFFNLNGWISVLMLAVTGISLFVHAT